MLKKIEKTVRAQLELDMAKKNLEAIKQEACAAPLPRDFINTIKNAGQPVIIAEIKPKSPSDKDLCSNISLSNQADAYVKGGAAALSVLTEASYFGGSPSLLSQIKSDVPIPVLRKDFILTDWQVYQSRAIGADALLLIKSLLKDSELTKLLSLTRGLGMAALVEVTDQDELKKAVIAGARMIGINNRDFKTLKCDIQRSIDLAPFLPEDRIIISASGISSHNDIKRLNKYGFNYYLVGTSLMKASDPSVAIAQLRGIT